VLLPSINGTELDTPQADRFAANGDASFSKQIINIAVAEIEAIVEPDYVTDDIWWGAPVWKR
jgi:hypothetical protein